MRRHLHSTVIAISLALFTPAALYAATPKDSTLNLKNADIETLIQVVSEMTGRGFVVDPKVQGKITVIVGKPMSPDELWDLFTSVLSVHGYAVVPSGGTWKILPEADAVGVAGAAPVTGPDSYITRVIEIHDVPASELSAILQRLISPNGRISVQGDRLVVTERAGAVERLERLIARIDTPSSNEVEVIPLDHANASDIAKTLSQLDSQGSANATSLVRLVADTRSNSILLSGNSSFRLRMRALIAHLDTPITDGDYAQVIFLQNAKASELAPLLESVAATLTVGAKVEGGKQAVIGFHAETNALIITAPPAVFRDLASIVRQLDVRRTQLMIEAIVAEVSDELADELGVQWQATSANKTADGGLASGVIGGTNFPGRGGVGGILAAMTNPAGVGPGLNLGYVGGTLKIPGPGGSTIDVLQIGALVRALRGDGRANILSQPSVVTLDNEPAEFKVTQEVPFLTGSYATVNANSGASAGGISAPFQTIERKDVGLILKVTPHVSDADGVQLEIVQEASSLSPTQLSGAVDLITNKREIKTTVQVADGRLLVLGGLSSEEVNESIQGIPGLSRIPLIGGLFKSRQSGRNRRNLMIFLRPIILRDSSAAIALSNSSYELMRIKQQQSNGQYEARMRGEQLPVFPALQTPADADAPPVATPLQPRP